MIRINSKIYLIFLIKLISYSNFVVCDEILGCGGFIKSHADIDFSKVEIKLLTKQGSLKDKTDCSPSNGYYFLPVYDKGEYLLEISPPPGWSFEPERVVLNFDGKNDICSQGKDVNFVFKGFGITGKVAIYGQSIGGARDVNVELRSEDGSDVRKTKTDLNGVFSFTPIIPGKYIVKASHNSWYFSKSEHTVVVKSGNTELPENSLIVSGFNVQGRFDNIGQASKNIKMVLTEQKTGKQIDRVEIEKNGEYAFKNVKPGSYKVVPFVTDKQLTITFAPENLEFKVEKDDLILKKSFEISGFRVFGKVLYSANGKGVPAAAIKLKGETIANTDSNGNFVLSKIPEGNYKLEIQAENLEFTEKISKISIENPNLGDFIVSSFKVCGEVKSDNSYAVEISKSDSTYRTTTATENNKWCAYLAPGKYSVEVITSEEDKANGIKFFPVEHKFEVSNAPLLSGIVFSQLRATLIGEIKCLKDSSDTCRNIEVTLHALDPIGKPTGQIAKAISKEGKYEFLKVLPGPYEVTIPQTNLCFESNKVLVNIASAMETAPHFIHKGYEISIISSHKATLKYKWKPLSEKEKSFADSIKIMSGVNTFCVPRSGEYSFTLEGCHTYLSDIPTSFTTNDKNPVVLTAVAHKIGIRVLSPESNIVSLKLQIETSTGKEIVTPISESHKVDGYHSYRYDMFLKPEEQIIITPQSNLMLFKPEMKEIVGGNDCIDVAFNFIAVKGLIIEGKIDPPISDAKITLNFPQNPEIYPQETISSAKGTFKFNPIDETLEYELRAEKESYVFKEYNKQLNVFKAHKLCDVIVSVKDDSGNKLNGVLLSLSGAESYRKNMVTSDDGTIKFHSLSPSQYFLRPMMKEYKFEPNSKMIDIKDGETVRVELIGKRVAYSVFGIVTSLNGEPFPNVHLEAISDEKCMHHQEESSTEQSGQYRIRGLQPGCTYTIRPKIGEANKIVERSIPESRTVKIGSFDSHDINLIAISPINFVDVTARIMASSNDLYKSLRIQLYRKGNADNPIYSQKVESPINVKARFNPGIMVFFPRIPLDGKTYFVELKTTLSERIYKFTLPSEQFIANKSSIYVELNFEPEIRTTEGDLNQNSISALLLVGLVAIAFFKQDLAMDLLNFVWVRINNLVQDLLQKSNNKKKETKSTDNTINYKEIEQIAEGINSIKKKKVKKI
ncbi:BOS complex subunit NOMO1 [Condylostylus longicornis]|uniref:BOS complex subunit NOMO1 n=1 Tax=Condylostylus longicornis TaxID=2530218 RepID=UPI00244E484B|nr:BOS complex subunit NOMO1 [Condylostylus longicornis]